jgi:hypothetical protein
LRGWREPRQFLKPLGTNLFRAFRGPFLLERLTAKMAKWDIAGVTIVGASIDQNVRHRNIVAEAVNGQPLMWRANQRPAKLANHPHIASRPLAMQGL